MIKGLAREFNDVKERVSDAETQLAVLYFLKAINAPAQNLRSAVRYLSIIVTEFNTGA